MTITRAQARQLTALERFTGEDLLTKDLKLFSDKARYKTFPSGIKFMSFLFGTFSDKRVARSVHKLLSSGQVQAYLRENQPTAQKIRKNITTLSMKFSDKGKRALMKTLAATRVRMDSATKKTIADAINVEYIDFFGKRGGISEQTQEQMFDYLGAAYPGMEITTKLGKGTYGHVHRFKHNDEGEIKNKVLKLTPWHQVKNCPTVYRMDEKRFGGEWLGLLARDEHIMKTFMALAYHEQTRTFVLIDREKLQKFRKNPSLLKGNTYHLVGTISQYIAESEELKPTGPYTPAQIRLISQQLLEAAGELHKQGIMHRDLKPNNVLMDRNKLHVIDFGFAKKFEKKGHRRRHSEVGTPRYISSARREGSLRDYDERVDIYAVGVILHDLVTGNLLGGKTPLVQQEYHKARAQDKTGLESSPAIKDLADRKLADLIGKLGAYEITDRPFADEALRHPYFTA